MTERFYRSCFIPNKNTSENLNVGLKISKGSLSTIVANASFAILDWPRSKSSSKGARKNKEKAYFLLGGAIERKLKEAKRRWENARMATRKGITGRRGKVRLGRVVAEERKRSKRR